MTVALETLDSRYLAPQPGLDSRWLSEALREVLAKVDEMMPRFTMTFPAASATDGRYPAVEKVDWTEGFWTGMLWLAWEVTGDDKYRTVAEACSTVLKSASISKLKSIPTTWVFSICSLALTPGSSPATSALAAWRYAPQSYCTAALMKRQA